MMTKAEYLVHPLNKLEVCYFRNGAVKKLNNNSKFAIYDLDREFRGYTTSPEIAVKAAEGGDFNVI